LTPTADHPPLITYVVYHNPTDFPAQYVVRGHAIAAGKVTPLEQPAYVGGSLQAARDTIQKLDPGLIRLPRDENDEPQIVEVWL